jgi:hypothetical protein
MDIESHKSLYKELLLFEEELMFSKGLEYSSEDDTLANFKGSEDIGVNSKQKLWIYLSKHLSSIKNYIKNNKTYSNESIQSRIADARNYLALLYILLEEEKGSKND